MIFDVVRTGRACAAVFAAFLFSAAFATVAHAFPFPLDLWTDEDEPYFTQDMVEDAPSGWSIVWQGEAVDIEPGTNRYEGYCLGALTYDSKAALEDEDVSEGPVWAYYATKKTDGVDCHDPDLAGVEDRLGYITMHGYAERRGTGELPLKGQFREAYYWARVLDKYGEEPSFVLSPTSPGSGYECNTADNLDHPTGQEYDYTSFECRMTSTNPDNDLVDQTPMISHGFEISAKAHRQGLSGKRDPLHRDVEQRRSYSWANASAARRALNLMVSESGLGGASGKGWVDPDRVYLAGQSGGAGVTMMVNEYDDRLAGAIAMIFHGGWNLFGLFPGDWYPHTHNDHLEGYEEYTEDYTLNCFDLGWECADQDSLDETQIEVCKFCEINDIFDPANQALAGHGPLNPTLMMTGSQDEIFPYPTQYYSYRVFSSMAQGVPVFRYMPADFDHGYYWNLGSEEETYLNWNPLAFVLGDERGVQIRMNNAVHSFARGYYDEDESKLGGWPVTIERVADGADVSYYPQVCIDESEGYPAPDRVRFGVTSSLNTPTSDYEIFYHVAKNTETWWQGGKEAYSAEPGDILTGVPVEGEPGCFVVEHPPFFPVRFDPEYLAAWGEYEWDAPGGRIVVQSGDVTMYDDHWPAPAEYGIRPKMPQQLAR
ncbi:MAG: hypothetical protein H6685_02670 [Deltaproteobacteria bacterium]|nr:hypothetical protein [Deltaproteobacteria bacterium]